MKTENPWVIIRWFLVVAVYVATLAIAVDQVRSRNKRIADLEAWQTNSKKLHKNISSGLVHQMDSLKQIQSDVETVQDNNAKAAKLLELTTLTAQRLQKQDEGKILTDKLEKNIAAGNRLAAEGRDLAARGSMTTAEVAEIKKAGQAIEDTARNLMAEFAIWKQELAQIDARRKVLKVDLNY